MYLFLVFVKMNKSASVFIQQQQSKLLQQVYTDLHFFVQLTWANQAGSIHTFTKLQVLDEKMKTLSGYYSCYYSQPYTAERIVHIKDVYNRNPHMKIKTDDLKGTLFVG